MRHIPGQQVSYWKPDLWLCDGLLHEHRSYEAAEKCERRGANARDSKGWTRAERETKAEARRVNMG